MAWAEVAPPQAGFITSSTSTSASTGWSSFQKRHFAGENPVSQPIEREDMNVRYIDGKFTSLVRSVE